MENVENRNSEIIDKPGQSLLYSLIIAVMAFSANMGERMNVYISSASRIFVFAGFAISLLYIIRILITKRRQYNISENAGYSFWFLMVIIMVIIGTRIFDGGQSISLSDLIDKYKIPLFMLFGLILSGVFLENHIYLLIFCWAYLIGFITIMPFGQVGDFTTAYRFVGTYSNPNTYGVDCIIAFFFSMYLLKDRNMRVIKIIFVLFSIVGLLRTGSRGALMSILIGAGMFFLFTKDFQRKFLFIVIGLLVAIGIFLYSYQDTTGIINRLFEKSYSGNIRLEIWKTYFNNMNKFFWFGAEDNIIYSIHHFTPHNSFFGVLVRFGIFALVPYVLFIIDKMVRSFKKGRIITNTYADRVLSSFVFSLVISGMTMENINNRSTWIIYGVVLYHVYNIERKIHVVIRRNNVIR